jgi:DNA-binding transcriptional ArsR family regulator
MEVTSVGHALSSETRVRLLRLIHRESMTSSQAFEQYQEEFNSPKYRESIYRELEELVEARLIEKQYDSEDKQLVYAVDSDIICYDIAKDELRSKFKESESPNE